MKTTETYLTFVPGNISDECRNVSLILATMYSLWATRLGLGFDLVVSRDQLCLIIHTTNNKQIKNLKSEVGIHRISRISPFDPQKRRHTSFVRVIVNNESCEDRIRSYIFTPWTLVANLRNKKQTNDLFGVLGGNLDIVW